MSEPEPPVTELLQAIERGGRDAADRLFPLVYGELRELARSRLARERSNHTLTPTALVNEAWLRLVGSEMPSFASSRHFLGVAAIAMRRILIDHARTAMRDKRGGGQIAMTLPTDVGDGALDPVALIELDATLSRLDQLDPSMARVVELRYFGGLTVEEAAAVLETSPRSVNRLWTAARAWLARELAR